MIALAAKDNLLLHQIDVTTAFLNGTMEEKVYMKQPEGFATKGQEHLVCKLKKSICGLKQSPRCWNVALLFQSIKRTLDCSKTHYALLERDHRLWFVRLK